ncbi:MAG: sel1 repeat family protein, partial [Treponema sp.]|nr:sel1 repeat family protein [Treponema sp.]
IYYNGNGVPKDFPEAEKWYKKAAEQGNLTAQSQLALMYSKAEDGVPRNDAEAKKWRDKAEAAKKCLEQLGII